MIQYKKITRAIKNPKVSSKCYASGVLLEALGFFNKNNMANRRMMSKDIIDTDMFLDMSFGSQNLYFHFLLRADDDGFISSPKKIMRMLGVAEDDFKVLIAKKFIIPFESGICVIKHWKVHNYIQNDRKKKTQYEEEKALLKENSNHVYSLDTECVQNVSKMETQVRLGKDRLGKGNTTDDVGTSSGLRKSVKEQNGRTLKDRMGNGEISFGTAGIKGTPSPLTIKRLSQKYKNKGDSFCSMVLFLGNKFADLYRENMGEEYLGRNFSMNPVARQISQFTRERIGNKKLTQEVLQEARKDLGEMLRQYFRSEKAEQITISLNSAFSDDTYLKYRQGRLEKKHESGILDYDKD